MKGNLFPRLCVRFPKLPLEGDRSLLSPLRKEFLGLVRMFPLVADSSSHSANTKHCPLPVTQPLFGHIPEARPKVSRLGSLSARGLPASFYADFLQPGASHCCAYLPSEMFVSCCPAPSSTPHPVPAPSHTILSSLGSVQTWEHMRIPCNDYILWAESLYVRVELQCFLYI